MDMSQKVVPTPKDAKLRLYLSKDQVTAEVIVFPPEGEGAHITVEAIKEFLAQQNIVYGINDDEINRVAGERIYDVKFVAAIGIPPEHGRDGTAEYMFDRLKLGLPKILEDGSADFKNIDKLSVVNEGDVLVRITLPTEGKAGITVHNTEAPPKPGRKAKAMASRNVLTSEDGLELIAEKSGEVRDMDGKISVFNCLDSITDVGLNSGNITFAGNIHIKGNVGSGFTVKATGGSVTVDGIVEAATIESDCDIVLKNGIKGGEKGKLIAGGSIVAKFIEGSTVTARGDIKCEAILNSTVTSQAKILAVGGPGLIVGRTVRAVDEIRAKTIGSKAAVPTVLEVGADPAVVEEFKKLEKELADSLQNLDKIDKAKATMTKLREAGASDAAKEAKLAELLKMATAINERVFDINNELERLRPQVEDVGAGKVRVKEVCYPGVKISIGRAHYFVKTDTQYTTFHREGGGDIKLDSF